MKYIFASTILILTISSSVFGQKNPEEFIDDFFKKWANKEIDKAIDDLYNTNPFSDRIRDGIANIKSSAKNLTEDYVGKYHGYELIRTSNISSTVISYSYLVKYERQPLRFVFTFYKPNDKWGIYSFKYDADAIQEVESRHNLLYDK